MTFEQLYYFVAAAECETFLDAAHQMHSTQSSLSKQIKKLENELECELFNRKKRTATLSKAGQDFYKEAIVLIRNYEGMLEKMATYSKKKPEIKMGILPITSQYNLTKALQHFMLSNQQYSISILEAEEPELLQGLKDSSFDLVIVRKSMVPMELCEFKPIAYDKLVVVVPQNHKFANKKHISIQDIKNEGFIFMHPYTTVYQTCMHLFEKYKIIPNIVRTARLESIISNVRLGSVISILPKKNLEVFDYSGLVAIDLKESKPLEIGIAYKRDNKFILPLIKKA